MSETSPEITEVVRRSAGWVPASWPFFAWTKNWSRLNMYLYSLPDYHEFPYGFWPESNPASWHGEDLRHALAEAYSEVVEVWVYGKRSEYWTMNRQCRFQNLSSTVAVRPTGTRQKSKVETTMCVVHKAWVRPAANDPISILIHSAQMRVSLGTFQWRALPCHTCMVREITPNECKLLRIDYFEANACVVDMPSLTASPVLLHQNYQTPGSFPTSKI